MQRLARPGALQVFGTWPLSFEFRDIIKGVVYGLAGPIGVKFLLGVKLDAVKGALVGGGTGLIGGFEDIFDMIAAPAGTLPGPGEKGYTDLPHELFQSGLLNSTIGAAVGALLGLILG